MISWDSKPCRVVPLALTVFMIATVLGHAQQEPGPRKTPPSRQAGRGEETAVGYIMRAELRNSAVITMPSPPAFPATPQAGSAHNEPVARNKGMTLLVLHFQVTHGHCIPLNREVLLVKDGNDKTYSYGGWRVESAEYSLCGRPDFGRPILGPWINTFWDPITIRPVLEEFDLVCEIEPAAKKLTFTDGKVVVDVDVLLKR
jgi:hypothetical protein